jgi:anti-sigma regulatory factor (Ser/Thr protein kinase)
VSPSSSGSDRGEADLVVDLSDISQVGEARRRAVEMATRLGFPEVESGQAALVVTESATNIIKHATRGEIVLRGLSQNGTCGLEIIALDQGPGMADPDRCFRDGYSTSGTPGTGLGAIRRLSSFLDVYSRAGRGTALVSRIWASRPDDDAAPWRMGALCVAKSGEPVCGDVWAVEPIPGGVRVLVADGLGHGPLAATAAQTATRIFRSQSGESPVLLAQSIHSGLRSTRGAAIALAFIDFAGRQVRYVGIGNISGVIVTPTRTQHLVSHNGTAGAEARKFQEFVYEFPQGATLILHSDGIATHWKLDAYPGLLERDPVLVAAVLQRDFTRRRDDSTVLALREAALERS